MNSFDSPVVLEGRLDSGISRALWLVKIGRASCMERV